MFRNEAFFIEIVALFYTFPIVKNYKGWVYEIKSKVKEYKYCLFKMCSHMITQKNNQQIKGSFKYLLRFDVQEARHKNIDS